jgi:hypothetical protein
MPKYITKTIGVGKDYGNLHSFLVALKNSQDGLNSNLVTSDSIVIADIYGRLDSGNTIFSGITTSTTRFVKLRAASGWRHTGYKGSGSTLKSTGNFPILTITGVHMWIESLIFEVQSTHDSKCIYVNNTTGSSTEVLIDRCMFLAQLGSATLDSIGIEMSGNSSGGDVDGYVRSSVFYMPKIGGSGTSCALFSNSLTGDVHVRVAHSAVLGSGGKGFLLNAGSGRTAQISSFNTAVVKSTGVSWGKQAGGGTETYGGNYNVSDDPTNRPGANSLSKSADACFFVSIDSTLEDARLLEGSPLIGAGADPGSGYLSNIPGSTRREDFVDKDISHNTRTGSAWTIGAHEVLIRTLYVSNTRETDVPLVLTQPDRGTDYNGTDSPNGLFNRQLQKIDDLLTKTSTENTSQKGEIQAKSLSYDPHRLNLLANAIFSLWSRGNSFGGGSKQFTADCWLKSPNAVVDRATSPSGGVSTFGLQIKGLLGGSSPVVWVKQKARINVSASEEFTFSIDVVQTNSGKARLFVEDELGTFTYSGYGVTAGGRERLQVNATIPDGSSFFYVGVEVNNISDTLETVTISEGSLVQGRVTNLKFMPKDELSDKMLCMSNVQKYTTWYIPTSGLKRREVVSTSLGGNRRLLSSEHDRVQVKQVLPVPIARKNTSSASADKNAPIETEDFSSIETENQVGPLGIGKEVYLLSRVLSGHKNTRNTFLEMGITTTQNRASFDKNANTKITDLLVEEEV